MEPYDKGLTRFIIDKSYSFFQKAVNSGTSREGPVFILLAQLAFLHLIISPFFTQNKKGGPGTLPGTATG